jgi:hypothetical protein
LQKSQKSVILRPKAEESRRDDRFFAALRMTKMWLCNTLKLELTLIGKYIVGAGLSRPDI